jgi:hypothetical protein
MPSSATGLRAIDNAHDDSDVPTGITGHVEAETEAPISELTASRARYCAGIGRLLSKDAYDLMEEQIFRNFYINAEMFFNELTEGLGVSETVDMRHHLFR